jgi:hypothetical protein
MLHASEAKNASLAGVVAQRVAAAKLAIRNRLACDFAAIDEIVGGGGTITPKTWQIFAAKLREELGL